MERALTATEERTRTIGARWSIDPGSAAAWLLPVALVVYLGVRSGGFDPVISDQVGIALWWAVFLVAALGFAPLRLTTSGKIGLGLLVAFAAWATLSLTWTESTERTMGDVTLMLTYVALALLAFLIRGRTAARQMLNGLLVGIVTVAVIALLSRLRFAWFSIPVGAINLPGSLRKLSEPIGYWNALAALVVMAIPLGLYVATGARTLIARALAAGCVPLLVLCGYFTASRGGTLEAALAVVVFLLLAPNRLPKVAVTLICGAGSALLVAAADQRTAVRDGLRTPLAAHQGDQMIAIAVAVVAGVALLAYAVALIDRHTVRPRWLAPSRRQTTAVALLAAVAALVVFVAAGGPNRLRSEWRQFKTPAAPAAVANGTALQRLSLINGNGRYQLWQAAVRQKDVHPWTGTGAATFIYWWARDGNAAGGFVEDTHSLYVQALGELGYPGFILITAFMAWILLCGVVRVIRGRDPDERLAVAAATAGAAVFAVSATIEWIWLIPVLPATLFMLAAVIFGPGAAPAAGPRRSTRALAAVRRVTGSRWMRWGARGALAVIALGAVVVIGLPLASTVAVRRSQADARNGNVAGALTEARQAVRLQPDGATPRLQEALVLELAGDIRDALPAAQQATVRASTDSDTWLVLSRLEARNGDAAAALEDYLHARALNPRSPVFSS